MLTALQKDIMLCLSKNRSETSYIAGGVALNRHWARLSDDIDVFHDTDEEIGEAAQRDMQALRSSGFLVSVDVNIYGCVEATVSKGGTSTQIQWMSETRTRFFPLVLDPEWGSRLHQVDLAINKVLAASSRTKARDFADLVSIAAFMCPLGPLVMAASGKPPHFSPIKIIEEIRRRGLSVSTDDYDTVRGLPEAWTAAFIRDRLLQALDEAEAYVRSANADTVGLLAVDARGFPVEDAKSSNEGISFRKATESGDVIPFVTDISFPWAPDRS